MEYNIKLKFGKNGNYYFWVDFPLVYTDEDKKNLFFDSYDVLLDLKNNRIEDKNFSFLVNFAIWNITNELFDFSNIEKVYFEKADCYNRDEKIYRLMICGKNRDVLTLENWSEEKPIMNLKKWECENNIAYYVYYDNEYFEKNLK